MNKFTPLIKGLITGIAMVAIQLLLYYNNISPSSTWTYVVYGTFAAGIVWTLVPFSRSADFTGKFGELFSQGFRCFIIIILVLVTYVYIFGKTHPELIEKSAQVYREELVKEGNRTPEQMDELVAKAKNSYVAGNVQLTIFATLILGAFFTAATAAGIMIARRK